MSYTALYRKYRPETFDEVKGQDHVVTTLHNQILADRIGHAYLFSGTRGTGKTSVAKIFARAVNCEHPVNGNPCNECESCRAILSGASLNVIEIDGASNNGVDNIRQIREEVTYPPTEGRYKVYIIDEAHMVTPNAFNALLKTLEEPPSYVIFILATTDPQRIPVTILSRCQRYDFRRISQEEIAARLTRLLALEQTEAEEKAIRYIARKADGGLRDALSLTDQCISYYLGEKLTYEKVLNVIGAVDTEVLGSLFRKILAADVKGVFTQLEQLIWQGRDLSQLAADFTEYLRDLLLLKSGGEDAADLLDVSEDNLVLLREEAALTTQNALLRYIRIFSELSGQMRMSANKRVVFEVALIKMCKPAMEQDNGSLLERIQRVEKMLESGQVICSGLQPASGAGQGQNPGTSGTETKADDPVIYEAVASDDLQQLEKLWQSIISLLSSPIYRMVLKGTSRRFDPASADDTVYVLSDDVMMDSLMADENLIPQLEQIIEDKIGKRIRISFGKLKNAGEIAGGRLQKIRAEQAARDNINMEIEFINEE